MRNVNKLDVSQATGSVPELQLHHIIRSVAIPESESGSLWEADVGTFRKPEGLGTHNFDC